MSTMTLQIPMNYVEIDRDEMEYVDGGISVSGHWWGVQISFNGNETNGLLAAIGTGSAASWLAAECAAAGIVTLPGSIPFGLVAAALAVLGGEIALVNWKNNYNGFSVNYISDLHTATIW